MRFCGDIQKFEDQADGSLLITGIASTEDVDRAGEIVEAEAMRKALPEYLRAGSIREMHQPIAAGKPISAFVDEDGKTHLTAKIVDVGTIAKIKAGVLKCFSIGGKMIRQEGNRIKELALREISVVDLPCNPLATFSICKIDQPPKPMIDQKFIAKALNLPETATEQEVADAFVKRLVSPSQEVTDLISKVEDLKKSLPADAAPLTQKLEALSSTVAKLQSSQEDNLKKSAKVEKDVLLTEASRDGKVIPLDSDEIEKLEVGTLRKMIDKLPKNQVITKREQVQIPSEFDKRATFIAAKRSEGIEKLDAFFKTETTLN